MIHLMHFLQSKSDAVRSLFFDKAEGGAIPSPPTHPQHFQHVTLPNGWTLMVPVNVTIAAADERYPDDMGWLTARAKRIRQREAKP